MEGLLLGCARRVCSLAARLNRNRVASRSFSSEEAPIIINEMGVNGDLESMMKGAEASENWELFKSWMLEHDRNYECQVETLFRYKLFYGKLKENEKFNKEYPDYTLPPRPISRRLRPRRFKQHRSGFTTTK